MKTDENTAITFDDVVIEPQFTDVLPDEPSLETILTKDIKLNIPFVSSPMSSVTEYKLAIKIAQLGGIGFIHRDLSPKKQVEYVTKVKRYEAFLIENPTVIPITYRGRPTKVKHAKELREKHGYSTFPVIDERRNLVGIVTDKDVRWRDDSELIEDVMTRDVITIPYIKNEKKLREMAIKAMLDNKVGSVVVLKGKSRRVKGLITETDIRKRDKFPYATRDKKGRLMVGAAVGVDEKERKRVDLLYKANVDVIVIDISHGHCKNEIEMLKWIKKEYNIPVVAGNIVTREGVEDLYSAGADCIRVGIGPGSTCTTRVTVGIGMPQLTAIIETYEIAKEYEVPIMADGGIRYSGDASKAICAGAHTVMIGKLFAGTDESPGGIVYIEGRAFKEHLGMASEGILKSKYGGGKSRYLEDVRINPILKFLKKGKIFSQGVEGYVEYAGPLDTVVSYLCEGVAKAMAASGARSIKEFHEKGKLRKISFSGAKEGHPSIPMKSEPANYRRWNE